MAAAHLAYDEPERLKRLADLCLLDTPPDPRFDSLVARALALFAGASAAALTLVDAKRVWFKSVRGMEPGEAPRESAFCSHAILGSRVMIVPDLTLDYRFATNALVAGKPGLRFYAGAPLTGGVGTLCVFATQVLRPSPAQVDGLAKLALLADTQILMHAALQALARATPASPVELR